MHTTVNIVKNFYIAAIGASAGGLEAIESFFSAVPEKSGLAYVIVQHLSPDYISLMPEILLKRTSLPVHTAEDGMLVEADNIYLIPRKMNMKIFHSRLHLTAKIINNVLNLPIDIFFQSLAEDFEDKAIGIILSGTGSDGSRGIRTIKEHGGIILVQNPESAKFDGMPRSGIATGLVDFILDPTEMPSNIIKYVKHPFIQEKDKHNEISTLPGDYMSKIILMLKDACGLDFTYYKDTTISRRIERRMSINQIEGLKDYLIFLQTSSTELNTLYKELLIGVTKFFRDTEAFLILRDEIIPMIFKDKTNKDEIRIWVSACSTGEEAYSIAILIKEFMIENNLRNDVKIFATDIDKSSVEFASMGVYSMSISADISQERLSRFFVPAGDNFRISAEIRELIVFATHNIIKDPPFNKIDFLSCRNLLIYFQPPLQQKVLSFFNFALQKNGILFLGSSESIGEMEHFYEAVNLKWKIYKTKENSRLPIEIITRNLPALKNHAISGKKIVFNSRITPTEMVAFFTDKILEDHAPTTVILSEEGQIINSFGDLNKYLLLPKSIRISDGFDYLINTMVPPNLKLTFSIAISKSIKTQEEVYYQNVKYEKSPSESYILDIKFVPVVHKESNSKYIIVYFIPKEKPESITTEVNVYEDVDIQVQQQIQRLELELKQSKENLQASIEELETTNEELQSTNEELISSNEELQSTNEELQSVNEELYTVNTEFQAKNHDLLVMNNDMENLLQNSDIRIIFLDKELKIRRFTENITDIFNLKKNDIGRPLFDITHHIPQIDLYNKAKTILTLKSVIQEVVKVKFKRFQMKILPYLTQKGFIDGVVFSFVDLTDFYVFESKLKLSEDKFRTVIETGFDAFYLMEAKRNESGVITDFIIIEINKQAEDQLMMKRENLVGFGICELFPVNRESGFFEKYKNVLETGVPYEEEYCIPNEYAAPGWFYHQVVPVADGIAIFNRDISKRKNMEKDLIDSRNLYQSLFHNLTGGFALHEMIYDENKIAVDYVFIDINQNFENLTGLKKETVIGKRIKEVVPNIEEEWIQIYGKVATNGESISFEMKSEILNKNYRVHAYSPQKGQFATIFDEIKD